VEVSLAYASDEVVQGDGVVVDAISVSTGEGTTSFENGDAGGWQVPGAPPEGSSNDNDWFVGGVDALPPPLGVLAQSVLGRQGEFHAFLEGLYGEYPFRDAGGTVHNADIGFALENQTRPTYPASFFRYDGTYVVVHEVSHQWLGDLIRLDLWQHVWLNEGFATYTEWLYHEHQGTLTAEDIFNYYYDGIPAGSRFWQLTIGDPGPASLFAGPVYVRGAMTLHELRRAVGDDAFFTILRKWTRASSEGRTASTSEFVALAERVSGRELGGLFQHWLFTPGKPPASAPAAAGLLRAAVPGAGFDPRILRATDSLRR